MDHEQPDLEELAQLVRDLRARVERLEQAQRQTQPVSVEPNLARERDSKPAAQPADPSNLSPVSAGLPRNPEWQGSAGGRKTKGEDLELRIGSNWLNRIGILALLIGVGYFLKYAFESDWLDPAARVGGALAAGVAVLLWSEWFRARAYRVFSLSLKAAGVGVLYLALWAALQIYALISREATFAALILVTAAAMAMALREAAEILELLALVGGFLTPVLISLTARELEMFFYLVVLDVAALLLVTARAWARLLLASFTGTTILYFAWYLGYYHRSDFATTLLFATIFFALIAAGPMVSYRRNPHGTDDSRVLRLLPALNAGVFFSQGYLLLGGIDPDARCWFALVIGIVYLALSAAYRANTAFAESLRRLHLTLALALFTVAVWLGFISVWVTILWFVGAGLLMVLGFWRNSPLVRWQALGLIAIAVVKVFAFDVWQLERGYRILSFLLLGVLLLVVSFLYQRDRLGNALWSRGEKTASGGRP